MPSLVKQFQRERRGMRAGIGSKGSNLRTVAALLLTIAFGANLASGAVAGDRRSIGTLRLGDRVFWNGDQIEGENETTIPLPVPVPSLGEDDEPEEGCGQSCIEYGIDVAERGTRLRVAIDTPDCQSSFSVELVDPADRVRSRDESCYSAEVYARDPAKGRWVARVIALGPDEGVFRMRAKLEGPNPAPGRKRALLPNLRVEPPHQIGFYGDEGDLGGSNGCLREEVIEDGAERCLRFSVGPQNVGDGPLELKFSREPDVSTDASMHQRMHYSDGTTTLRDAGSSEFHKTHQHFHLKGFAKFKLFRVTDRSAGTLKEVGTGNKAGFCLVDLRIARWRRFDQERAYSARSNCFPVGGKAELGLSAGWTDVYGYELPGNYIDLAGNPEGYYVIRVVVDSGRRILESNERDNIGYAYVNIKGSKVTLVERGQGKGPWDRNKTVSRGWGGA